MARRKITLREAEQEYLEQNERRGRSVETVRVDKQIIDRLIRYVGDILTMNLHKGHIEKMFYGEGGLMDVHATQQYGRTTNAGVSPATHNQYRNRLKVFFEWLANHDYLSHTVATECFDKAHGVVQPMKVPEKKRQRPGPHTLLSLLDAAENPRDRCWIAMALNTGLRSSEMKPIRWKDVDLDEGYLYVTIQKTGQEDEQPITADLDTEIRRWVLKYQTDLGRALEPEDLLFPSRVGGQISGSDTDETTGKRVFHRSAWTWVTDRPIPRTEKIVKKALERIGLETRYEGTHTVRRAVALAYFDLASQEKGDVAALRETAALLHHKSMATTERYIGQDADKRRRNNRMRGKPFLSAMVDQSNVVQLPGLAAGE